MRESKTYILWQRAVALPLPRAWEVRAGGIGVQFPRRHVFGSHLSGAEEFAFPPSFWLCWCVSLPMHVDISLLSSAQGPPGQIGTPGIRGEQGVPGPRVSPSAHSQPGASRSQPRHPTEFPTVL